MKRLVRQFPKLTLLVLLLTTSILFVLAFMAVSKDTAEPIRYCGYQWLYVLPGAGVLFGLRWLLPSPEVQMEDGTKPQKIIGIAMEALGIIFGALTIVWSGVFLLIVITTAKQMSVNGEDLFNIVFPLFGLEAAVSLIFLGRFYIRSKPVSS